MKRDFYRLLTDRAETEGVSLNQYIAIALATAAGASGEVKRTRKRIGKRTKTVSKPI